MGKINGIRLYFIKKFGFDCGPITQSEQSQEEIAERYMRILDFMENEPRKGLVEIDQEIKDGTDRCGGFHFKI
jgi:hypothetical protein